MNQHFILTEEVRDKIRLAVDTAHKNPGTPTEENKKIQGFNVPVDMFVCYTLDPGRRGEVRHLGVFREGEPPTKETAFAVARCFGFKAPEFCFWSRSESHGRHGMHFAEAFMAPHPLENN